MPTLVVRVFSAVIAAATLIVIYSCYGINGLKYFCFIAPAFGVYEIGCILFKRNDSKTLRLFFALGVISVFLIGVFLFEHAALGFAVVSILFCSIAIVFEKKFSDLYSLSLFQAKSILGFFYVGLLPALAVQVINLPRGDIWFFTLLGTVFAGDTFAYIFGRLFGNKKILPNISPKKTIVGSFGGLFGSIIAMIVASQFIENIPTWALVLLAIVVGILAQLGDLFESMLKRVANVKDSGRIMPGHGGVLDRLDGVLFGAPPLLAGAIFLSYLFK